MNPGFVFFMRGYLLVWRWGLDKAFASKLSPTGSCVLGRCRSELAREWKLQLRLLTIKAGH